MSNESVDFQVLDTTTLQHPVAGVTVKVTSQDGSTFFTQGTTDTNGNVSFLLPSGATYQARFYKFQTGFSNPQLFTVTTGQSGSYAVSADILTPPVPLDARLCTAYGYFRDITGAPQDGVDIQFIAKFDPVWLEGSAVVKERVIVRGDKNGYVQVNLIRNAQYDCTIAGEEDVVRLIKVPDAPNVNLPDLLFPIVAQVVADPPGPYTLTTGQELAVALSIYASDGENLGMAFGDVLFATTDGNVLNYTVSTVGMTLIGVGPGTASITIKRADQSIVHIPDPGVLGQPLVATVT